MAFGDAFRGDDGILSNLFNNVSAMASGTYQGDSYLLNLGQGVLNNFTGNRDQANLDITREREDTAIQRQVADAEAAGINPMALVGSGMGAPTSTAPSTQGRQDPVKAALSLAQFDKQMSVMDAQANSLNAAAQKSKADAKYSESRTVGQDIENYVNDAVKDRRVQQVVADYDRTVEGLVRDRELNVQEKLRTDILSNDLLVREYDAIWAELEKKFVSERFQASLERDAWIAENQILAAALAEINVAIRERDDAFFEKYNVPSNISYDGLVGGGLFGLQAADIDATKVMSNSPGAWFFRALGDLYESISNQLGGAE